MGGHEEVPADIAKTLVGWKKHFNSYTQSGRFNTVLLSVGLTAVLTLYFTSGKKTEKK